LQLCGDVINTFWHGKHKLLAGVLSGMHLNGQRVDMVSVLGQLSARGLITKIDGPALHSIYSGPGDHSGVRWYGDRLRKLAARRHLREAAIRATQHLDHAWGTGDDDTELVAIAQFRAALDEVEAESRPEGLPVPLSMEEFLDGTMDYDWLIPGLLERSERLILTGVEGGGKSIMMGQLATTMAGGVHSFTGAVLGQGNRGVRVTVVDCENTVVQARRRFTRITGQVNKIRAESGYEPMNLKQQMAIEVRPEGIDLLRPRDISWLEHVITSTAPDVLVLGPLYKSVNADPSDETAARSVAAVFDGLRSRHGFALLIEAHSPKADDGFGNRRMAPIGSSLWMRWPEYGFGLRRAAGASQARAELVDVVAWRGSREERQWPEQLRHAHRLPWQPPPTRGDDQDDERREREGW
jgi:AAA domain